ncbi:hypothetical protein L13192_06729 [Pyrenophora tritici-repentis]|nr:hypothetical protein L13192_06729 [Pyrenophora tritici-repentis]
MDYTRDESIASNVYAAIKQDMRKQRKDTPFSLLLVLSIGALNLTSRSPVGAVTLKEDPANARRRLRRLVP